MRFSGYDAIQVYGNYVRAVSIKCNYGSVQIVIVRRVLWTHVFDFSKPYALATLKMLQKNVSELWMVVSMTITLNFSSDKLKSSEFYKTKSNIYDRYVYFLY